MINSPYLNLLKDRINLDEVPFTDRGSRILVFKDGDSFYIRLAERWIKRTNDLAAYRLRPPIITGLVFCDEDGRSLDSTVSTFPHQIVVHTIPGDFTITFADSESLLITFPSCHCGVTFQANLDKSEIDRRGGILRLTGNIRRNIAYTTNARIIFNQISAIDVESQQIKLLVDATGGAELLLNITPRLGFNRYIPDRDETIEAAATRWHNWFASAPAVIDSYREQYYFAWWVMRAGLISPRFYTTHEAMTPSKVFYVGVWQWDAYFHSVAFRYVDKRLAQDQMRILLDHQRSDGLIPDAVHDEGIVDHLDFPVVGDVTKPPLVAWAAWKLFELDQDVEFLNEIYENIKRNTDWWFDDNDGDGNGLCEYWHPFSSGLDDSPLWDDGMPVESPDINSYLCIQQDTLAKIAHAIGEEADAAMWHRRAEMTIQRMIDLMWDEKAGLFWATKNGMRVAVRTPFNLFPLITGRLPKSIADRLVAELTNEEKFWPRYPIPSVALDDPKFDANTMWRGPTWVNVNYLMIEGLFKAGYPEIARELRKRTLELIGNQKDIYEYYNPKTGINPPKAAAIFGWTSAVFIDLAIHASREEEELKREKIFGKE